VVAAYSCGDIGLRQFLTQRRRYSLGREESKGGYDVVEGVSSTIAHLMSRKHSSNTQLSNLSSRYLLDMIRREYFKTKWNTKYPSVQQMAELCRFLNEEMSLAAQVNSSTTNHSLPPQITIQQTKALISIVRKEEHSREAKERDGIGANAVLTLEHRDLIKRHVEEEMRRISVEGDGHRQCETDSVPSSTHTRFSIPQICTKLQNDFFPGEKISKKVLHDAVRVALRSIQLRDVTKEERATVKSIVDEWLRDYKPTGKSRIALYTHVQDCTKLPRNVVRILVRIYEATSRSSSLSHMASSKERALVRRHIRESPHAHDTMRLCDELKSQMGTSHISRAALYHMVRNESLKWLHTQVSEHQRKQIVQFLSEKHMIDNVPELCSELQQGLCPDVRRDVLYQFVENHFQKRRLKRVTEEQRQLVREFVRNYSPSHLTSPTSANIAHLCEELQSQLNLPKRISYQLVRTQCVSAQRTRLGEEQRRVIREHVEHSPNAHDVQKLYSELKDRLPSQTVSKTVLLKMLHTESTRMARKRLTKEQRRFIKEYAEQSLHTVHDTPLLCNELQNIFPQLPRSILHELLQAHFLSREKNKITPQQRDFIKERVASSQHSNLVSLCDELQDHVDVSRRALYSVVYAASRKTLLGPKEVKDVARQLDSTHEI